MYIKTHLKCMTISLVTNLLLFVYAPSLYAADWTIYDVIPDVSNCAPGLLSQQEKADVLGMVNRIRQLHNLAPVVYAPTFDQETLQASLMMVANDAISHLSDPSWLCYTEAGQRGLATSNLYWQSITSNGPQPPLDSSVVDITTWLIDDNVPWLGHRRWLLDPFLTQISYNRVDGKPIGGNANTYVRGAALKIIYEGQPNPATVPDFVAYPYGAYPQALILPEWFWSFSAVVDKANSQNNGVVDFAQASVRVTSRMGEHRVHSQSYDNNFSGLPNFLQWRVDGIEAGEAYRVQIENVNVEGQLIGYEYDVMIVSGGMAEQVNIVAQLRQTPTPTAVGDVDTNETSSSDVSDRDISSSDVSSSENRDRAVSELADHVALLFQRMQTMGNQIIDQSDISLLDD